MSNHFKDFSAYLPTRSGCTDIYKEVLDHLNVIRKKYSDNGILRGVNADLGSSWWHGSNSSDGGEVENKQGTDNKVAANLFSSIDSHVISWHDIITA